MSTIIETDFIDSIADSLQYISYYHSPDFIKAMYRAWKNEESPAARDAIAQILTNSRLAATDRRPICQDTGIVIAFIRVGMEVRWDCRHSIEEMVNLGVRRSYTNPVNPLRASVVSPPFGQRSNTGDNTPAVTHIEIVQGDKVEVHIAAKGGGSENKSKFAILNPSEDLVEWVMRTVPTMGAGWCPPGILGIGIGGSSEKAMLLAKQSLLDPIDIDHIIKNGPANYIEELRLELYEKVNQLGIGAQGLGGLTTVLDIKVKDYPTHAASLPIAMIPNCAATRHIHFTLDGNGPAVLTPPRLEDWPQISWQPGEQAQRVNLDTVDRKQISSWRPGQTLLLSGKLLTGRDAAHKKISDLIESGKALPKGIDFNNRFIYYVGPVDAVGDEVVGPAGPTTATRMDKFSELMLGRLGLLGMIGKAERSQVAIEAIKKHASVYLIAVGGAAYLVSKAIRSARVLAFPELGMEAIYEFEVEDMPVTVAVDASGDSIHNSGPLRWKQG